MIVFLQPLLVPMNLGDKLLILAVIAIVSISFYLGVTAHPSASAEG